jgi:hypothetical protein
VTGHRKWADVKAEMLEKRMSQPLGNLPFLLATFDMAVESREPTYDVANAIIGEVRRLVARESERQMPRSLGAGDGPGDLSQREGFGTGA